jgi:hypothetical protein
MVVGLVPPDEEDRICAKLIEYYKRLYEQEGVIFRKEEKILAKKDIGEIYYTYPGEEEIATEQEKMRMIAEAIGHGYGTPAIILQKGKKMILLDGHRRLRVAWKQGMSWKAYFIVPSKEIKFGIEKMVLGKIKDLYEK